MTANSVNCAFARIQLAVGFDRVIDTAHKMGITQQTLVPVLSLTLGAIESTSLEMATVASTIANGGTYHPAVFVSKIEDAEGEVVFDVTRDVPGVRAISPETAACEIDLLRGVISGGTGTAARLNDRRDVFGKTGTTDARADANFLGATPQLATFVWHGNATARIPGAGFGGQVPARIFKAYMDRALVGQPAFAFGPAGPSCARPGAGVSEAGRGVDAHPARWRRTGADRARGRAGGTRTGSASGYDADHTTDSAGSLTLLHRSRTSWGVRVSADLQLVPSSE